MEELERLTNRHIAKLLDKLEQIQTPNIIKDAVKQQFRFFSKDIRDNILNNAGGK